MLDTLRERITKALGSLRGNRKLTEAAVEDTLRQVRRALLEADVALPVAREFTELVRQRTVNAEVLESLSPAQTIISIVYEELTLLLGESNVPINQAPSGPTVILIAGLQGSGKTTTAAKLAQHFKQRSQKRVLLASVDVYRPAAIDQLRTLAETAGAHFWETDASQKPEDIAKAAVSHAKKSAIDIVIVDSAGRLHVDTQMMDEIQGVHRAISPHETLFVIDAMIGQDAVNSASAFDETLELTGVIVTKLDSDTRGGALMSVRQVTGKPVKFIGVGEGIDSLEQFHPDRIASRIIGMGDVQTLIESVQQKADQDKVKRFEQKIRKGQRWDLADYRDQIQMSQDMGGASSFVKMIPGLSPEKLTGLSDADATVRREIAIINSMTPHERQRPAIVRASRRARIAAGSGVEVRHVSQLLRKFEKMQKMMRKLRSKNSKMQIPGLEEIPGMEQLRDRFPS